MNIQSISVCVPAKRCINDCKFCCSKMHAADYEDRFTKLNTYDDYIKKLSNKTQYDDYSPFKLYSKRIKESDNILIL